MGGFAPTAKVVPAVFGAFALAGILDYLQVYLSNRPLLSGMDVL
jgi:hypothetical protein